ncbi:hypothetical protein Bca4012_060209 [Brassica carinata]
MEKKSDASQWGVVLFLLVVLLVPTHIECAFPSHQQPLPILGRRLMSITNYKTNGDIDVGGSSSGQAGGWNNP